MIYLKVFVFNSFQENTIVLYDDSSEALIIDAGCYEDHEMKSFTDFIDEKKLKPVMLISTHGHIDHVLGNSFLKEKYSIPYLAHEADLELIKNAVQQGSLFGLAIQSPPLPDSYFTDGQEINFGNSKFRVIHVPGHSPGGVALYIESAGLLIAGDIIFSGSIGRTDLYGGNYEQLIKGIKDKLLVLPDQTVIYPGHGPKTSIAEEKRSNPFLV